MGEKKPIHLKARGLGRPLVRYAVGAVIALGLYIAGCGTEWGRPIVVTQCGGDEASRQIADEVVVLHWDGGVSHIYPNDPFDGMDLNVFETTEGGTLADHAAAFKSLVHDKVTAVYCDLAGHAIHLVMPDEADYFGAKTVVYYGQLRAPDGGGQVGEADYDPCNRRADDEAIIFGSQFARLGGPYSIEQWATMFANTTAHEIGHTLGYGHVTRAQQPEPERSLYVELMLDRHTLDELQRTQRIVVDQTSCPSNDLEQAGSFAAGKRESEPEVAVEDAVDDVVYICTHADH